MCELYLDNKKNFCAKKYMAEPWNHYAKWKMPDTRSHMEWFNLYDKSKIGKSMDIESSVVVTRDQERWVTANEYEVSFKGMKMLWN